MLGPSRGAKARGDHTMGGGVSTRDTRAYYVYFNINIGKLVETRLRNLDEMLSATERPSWRYYILVLHACKQAPTGPCSQRRCLSLAGLTQLRMGLKTSQDHNTRTWNTRLAWSLVNKTPPSKHISEDLEFRAQPLKSFQKRDLELHYSFIRRISPPQKQTQKLIIAYIILRVSIL